MPPRELSLGDLGLRVLLFLLIAVPSYFIFPVILPRGSGLLVVSAISVFAAGALANVVSARVWEHGDAADFGLGWSNSARRDLLLGIAGGAGSAALIMAASLAFREAAFERSAQAGANPWIATPLVSLVLLFGAAGEEMLFHGYAFQILARRFGAFSIILPVGFLFGLAHLGNSSVSLLAIFNTMAWGILLGYAWWRSGALWMPLGIHFGWNFALPLFGANLSGFTMGMTGYSLHWRAEPLWSGGAYGPEGGLPATIAVVALFWALGKIPRGTEV